MQSTAQSAGKFLRLFLLALVTLFAIAGTLAYLLGVVLR